MKDLSFAEVAPRYDEWARTDVTQDELLDGLIDTCRYYVEQGEEMQANLDTCREVIHTQSREKSALAATLAARDIEIAALRAAADAPGRPVPLDGVEVGLLWLDRLFDRLRPDLQRWVKVSWVAIVALALAFLGGQIRGGR